ncbi:hypothetical protein B0H14DRAFT_2590483 [Mycena olivaceomarginata]|nr:hypothetical protein B0H14DRAFT_2590483 [Mycena olivaceomarginata]
MSWIPACWSGLCQLRRTALTPRFMAMSWSAPPIHIWKGLSAIHVQLLLDLNSSTTASPTTSASDNGTNTGSSSSTAPPTTSVGDSGSNTSDTLTAMTTSNSTVGVLLPSHVTTVTSAISDHNTWTSPVGSSSSPGLINPAMRAVNTGISLNSADTALIVAFANGAPNGTKPNTPFHEYIPSIIKPRIFANVVFEHAALEMASSFKTAQITC